MKRVSGELSCSNWQQWERIGSCRRKEECGMSAVWCMAWHAHTCNIHISHLQSMATVATAPFMLRSLLGRILPLLNGHRPTCALYSAPWSMVHGSMSRSLFMAHSCLCIPFPFGKKGRRQIVIPEPLLVACVSLSSQQVQPLAARP